MTGAHSLKIEATAYAVSSVTVFRNQAEVTRVFPVELKTGANEIVIRSLPWSLESDGLRVQGSGPGVVVLDQAVTLKGFMNIFGSPLKTDTKRMKELRAHKRELEASLKLLNAQASILLSYSEAMKPEHVSPDKFLTYIADFHEAGQKNIEAIKEKEKELAVIEKAIKKEEESDPDEESQEQSRSASVSVTVKAEHDVRAELKLIYVVKSASWNPSYELVAKTEGKGQVAKTVKLNYRASITQQTGEDWRNAAITLSTRTPANFFSSWSITRSGLVIKPGDEVPVQNWIFGKPNNAFGQPNHQGNIGALQNQHLNQLRQPQQQQQQQQQLTLQAQRAQQNAQRQQQAAQEQLQRQQFQHQQQQQQQQRPPSTGLFGGFSQQPAGGLFGSAPSAFGAPAPPQFTGFGSAAVPSGGTTAIAPASTSLFGASGTSLFGSGAPPPATGAGGDFAGIGLGSSPAPTPSAPPGPLPAATEFAFNDAIAEASAIDVTYKIDGQISIPSGPTVHRVSISHDTVLPVEVHVLATPRLQSWAHLQATIKNTSEEAILAGPAQIMNENGFSSSIQIPFVAPGDTFTCSLGIDNKVTLTYVHTESEPLVTQRTFAGSVERTECATIIRVKNAHAYALPKLVVRDAIPVAKDPFSVILTKPKALASAEQDGTVDVGAGMIARWSTERLASREAGLVEWVLKNLDSGKEETIQVDWSVECPVGGEWGYLAV